MKNKTLSYIGVIIWVCNTGFICYYLDWKIAVVLFLSHVSNNISQSHANNKIYKLKDEHETT